MKNLSRQIRVVIADDLPAIIDAVAKWLSPDYIVVARAGDGAALVESVLNLKPDLIVTDVSMPGVTGIEALRRLHQRGVRIPTIVLTVHDDEDLVEEALSLGALGFVLKRRLVTDLPLAARAVLNGREFVSEPVGKQRPPSSATVVAPGLTVVVQPSTEILLQDRGLLIARTEGTEWQPGMAPGCERKVLFVDDSQKFVTSLVRMQAGTHFPTHRHGGPEEVFMLSGDLVIEGQEMKAGDYCRAETTTIHGVSYTKMGCVFLLRASKHDEIIGSSTWSEV